MLKCHASLFCNNPLNSSDSSLYDWYDDDGISNCGPQVCATGLRDMPLKSENATSMLSQLIKISLPVINCKNSDSDFPCNEWIYCLNGPDTVVLGQLPALT